MTRVLASVASALVISAIAFVASPAFAQRLERRTLSLAVGEQITLPSAGVARFSVSLPGYVDVRAPENDRQREFVLVGLRSGGTSLLFINNDGSQVDYRITVRGADTSSAATPTTPTGAVPERENIRLDLYFVAISETYGHRIGIGWPAFIGGGQIGRFTLDVPLLVPNPMGGGSHMGDTSATASLTNQPLPRLDLLQSNGWARIQRQSTLIAANQTEAVFQTQGEVNIQVAGALSAQLQQITFGSELRFTPNYDKDTGRIDMRIVADMSDLTDDRGTGVPGRQIAHVETSVNLEVGQAIVLAGLYSESLGETNAGLPGLSQIPIIGVLFGTNNRRLERVRNVMFVVPTVVDVLELQRRDMIGEAFHVYEQFDGGANEANTQFFETPRRPGQPRERSTRQPAERPRQ